LDTVYQSYDVIFKAEEVITSRAEFVTLIHKLPEDKPIKSCDDQQEAPIVEDVYHSLNEPSRKKVQVTLPCPKTTVSVFVITLLEEDCMVGKSRYSC